MVTTTPDALAAVKTIVAAAATAPDDETCAYFLAHASLALRDLEAEVREVKAGLEKVRGEAVKKWRGSQLSAKRL
jgi:hypothetical protein